MATSHASHLFERESELADLARDVEAARHGNGKLVLVVGPAGVGKTALLSEARSLAETAGFAVAHGRGTELERGFAYGVARQLFEPFLRSVTPRERARLLRGWAGLAQGVFVPGGEISSGERLPEVLQGLYWLTLNLAEQGPLLVVVDDAHWADPASLQFLSYLAGRLEGAAVLELAAARPALNGAGGGELATMEREPSTRVAALRPLSASATAELLARGYGQEVAPAFALACHRATDGNPFFLHELLRALRADGIDPTTEEVPRIAHQGPASVARSVLTRIAGLSSAAATVARALAVLGGEADLRDLAKLSSIDAIELDEALDLLASAEAVGGSDPVVFSHPIVQASIYEDIPAGERARTHLRAARMLATAGADAERVAAHLLATRPAGEPWTVGVLTRAAVEALARGAPEGAVAYLTRALAEPAARRDLQPLLALLGRARYLANQPGAAATLIEAMNGADTPRERGELALQAATALIMAEREGFHEAIRILERTLADLGDRESQLAMRVEAQLVAAAGMTLSTRPLHQQQMDGLYPRHFGNGPAERLLLANLSFWTLIDGRVPGRFSELARHGGADGSPAEVARRVAERAIAAGALLREEGADSELVYVAITTLRNADFLGQAQHWLEKAIEDARNRGSVLGYAQASASLADVAYRQGDLVSAEAHATAAFPASPGNVLAVLADIMIEQGRLEEAERLIEPFAVAPPADHLLIQPIQAAVARLNIAQGRTQQGADQLLACSRWLETWGVKNPSVTPWRSSAALALRQLGDADHARELAAQEVMLARLLGQPRTLGIALRALGLLEEGIDRLDLLSQAITELGNSQARLEHARALVDYGATLRRHGHRADARNPLREGLDLAHRSRATALSERAHHELLATGARPRTQLLRGRDALTPTEARVADMAAERLTTPEIAQALFVTPKTIETHLAHIYRKLDIHSRSDIAHALSQASPDIHHSR